MFYDYLLITLTCLSFILQPKREDAAQDDINVEPSLTNGMNENEAKPSNYSTAANKKTFFNSFSGNHETQAAIFRFLSRDRDRRPTAFTQEDKEIEKETLQKICKMLLSLYRYVSVLAAKAEDTTVISGRTSYTLASVAKDIEKNRTAVFQYLPYLISIYLCTQQKIQEKKQYKFLETFLLTLYNCEAWTGFKAPGNTATSQTGSQQNPTSQVQTPGGTYKKSPCQHSVTVVVPSLSQSSVYHSHANSDPVERVSGSVAFTTRPFIPAVAVNATTRPHILHLLFHVFNNHIMDLSKTSLELVAKAMISLVGRGHTQTSLHTASRQRGQIQFKRIHLPGTVLIELLITAHHCIFNGLSTLGNQIVDLVELKAAGNGWADVLVVVGAMRNLAKTWSGDGAGRGLRAATTDAHYANSPGMQIAKHMITNASFRAKKISEDIPKVVENAMDQHLKAKLMTNMKAITEEIGADPSELVGNSNNSTGQQGVSATSAINTKTPTKNVAANVADAVKFSKDKLISKEKLMAKLPSALGKVVIHKSKSDRNEKTSEGGMLASGGLSSVDKTGGSDGLSPGGDSDIEAQNLRPPRSSFERENFLSPQSDQIGRKDEPNVIKEDRKKSVFEVRKPGIMKIDKKSASKEEKDRLKQDKKAEEKAAKQEKKREKEANRGKKLADPSQPMLQSENMNASVELSTGIDELELPYDNVNNRESPSGIPMMTFKAQEPIGTGLVEEMPSATGYVENTLTDNANIVTADTLEKVEELIQKKRLPSDQTITIHSPESGNTSIF